MTVEIRAMRMSSKVVSHPILHFIRYVKHRQFVKKWIMSDCVESFGDILQMICFSPIPVIRSVVKSNVTCWYIQNLSVL